MCIEENIKGELTMTEPVDYVLFGGAQVPKGTKREVIDRNGQKIYCVWTDDKGGKVTYPKQVVQPSNTMTYVRQDNYSTGFADVLLISREYISKNEFYDVVKRGNDPNNKWYETSEYFKGPDKYIVSEKSRTLGGRDVTQFEYYNEPLDATPKIEVFTNNGLVFDTQNVTLSNMRGATVTGSTDEDNITLMNSSNCTVDISNANNNIFVSDNVRVVNGQCNKVQAGDHDQVTFRTFNYETATATTKANHKGEGTYKQ